MMIYRLIRWMIGLFRRRGFIIKDFHIVETSLVSVPANPDCEIVE